MNEIMGYMIGVLVSVAVASAIGYRAYKLGFSFWAYALLAVISPAGWIIALITLNIARKRHPAL